MISIGGINITDSVVNMEFRLGVVERILDKIVPALPPQILTQQAVDQIRQTVIADLQKKYPNAGIKLTSPDATSYS